MHVSRLLCGAKNYITSNYIYNSGDYLKKGAEFGESEIIWHLGMGDEPLLDNLWFYVASLRIKSDSSVILERDYESMNDAINVGSLGGEGQKRMQNQGVVTSSKHY